MSAPLDRAPLVSVAALSPREIERRRVAAELDALARRETPVVRDDVGLRREARAHEAKLSADRRAFVEFQLEHAHEMPIPADAPPRIRELLERVHKMPPHERARLLAAMGIEPVPERVRGHFTLTDGAA